MVGDTIIEEVVSPVVHTYEAPPDAESVADDPLQIKLLPVIVGIIEGLTVIVTELVAVPQEVIAVTV